MRSDLQIDAKAEDFLAELGRKTIYAYLQPIRSHVDLWPAGVFDPLRYAKRLFHRDGTAKRTFMDFAGEVLAAWCDESFSGRICGRRPQPHDTTPVFDSIAYEEIGETVTVYLIQAKTTRHHPASSANLAARKFARMENGDFDRELSLALSEMASLFPAEAKRRSVMSAIYAREQRRFCVSTIHGAIAPATVLTRYDIHVKGDATRRAALFLRLPEWENAWEIAAAAAYAEISN